jgi:oxygen-independent coproporphyrinogen-3 oxidase
MVEEGTPFFAERDTLPIPTLDEECDMYGIAAQVLSEAGYEHYEISNYARPGYRSRHNSLYWNLGEYIGVGAAAHSFYNGVRYSIIRTQDLIDELILVCERKVKCKKSNQNNLEQPYPSI